MLGEPEAKATLSKPKVLGLAKWAEFGLGGSCRCSVNNRDAGNPDFSFPQQKHLGAMNPYPLLFSNRLKALTCALDSTPPPIQSDLLDWLVLGSIYEQ